MNKFGENTETNLKIPYNRGVGRDCRNVEFRHKFFHSAECEMHIESGDDKNFRPPTCTGIPRC